MKASKCKIDVRAGAVMWATLCIFLGQPSQALPQEFFYQGKTITVISGREPGGLGDLRHRAILPYLKKHIPGQPNIVTEYMPGGGGRKVANHIYRTAQPDGLIIGSPPDGFILAAVLKEPGVNYELDKFAYFGSAESEDHYVFLTRGQSGHVGPSPRHFRNKNRRAIGGPYNLYLGPIVRLYSAPEGTETHHRILGTGDGSSALARRSRRQSERCPLVAGAQSRMDREEAR